MKCPRCQQENRPGAKFCGECAAPLACVCANCGAQLHSTAKFCSECAQPAGPTAAPPASHRFGAPETYTPKHLAERILTSRAALKGERKLVTVLFSDLKSSMELLADRDPEEARKILDPVLELMMEAVHRYEGTVNQVMGDGIMALFGAPLAHEDHAVRACYAALRMQESVRQYAEGVRRDEGVSIQIRIGVNSGDVVVRSIGSDLRMDYSAVGQTTHLAARLEQLANPGSILLTTSTLTLVEGFVAVKSLGPVPVKGLTDPVDVYEVTGAGLARTRLQAAARRGLTSFVGREGELEQLRRAKELAGNGHGQVAAVVGEAGVGKSRLVHEFLHSQHTADWLVLDATSASYDRATPYRSVIELLRRYFKIKVHDSTRSIREKISDRTLALDPAMQDSLPPLLDLLDALDGDHPFRSLDPSQHRQRTYRAVARLLLCESRVQPVVTVIEDLHWNDALTLGLLKELVVAIQNARLLLIVTYRPDYVEDWRSQPNYHHLRLDPLRSESLAELLLALLGSDPSLSAIRSFLVNRASGNPFFVEEIVRVLVDTAVLGGTRGNYRLAKPFPSIEVPPTIRAVLAARIDVLRAAEKRVLEEAAVIGHDVPLTLLQAICGLTEDRLRGLLDNLQTAELLYARQILPDTQYSFKHALTHDVAYSGMLHDRRREIHALVVDAIERLYADRLGEQVERLAHHAVQGEKREKAVHYLWQAGGKAAARSALSEARACFEQALGVLAALPESRAALERAFEIRLELRRVLRQLGEGRKMLEHLREAEAVAERLQDDRRRGQVCALMATVHSTLGEFDEALVTGTRALEIGERLGDLKIRIVATSHLEQAYYHRAEYRRVLKFALDKAEAPPAAMLHEYFGMAALPSVFGRAYAIMSLAELGEFAAAAQYTADAIRLAESTQHHFTINWASFAASTLHLAKGDWAEALAQVKHWLATIQIGNITIHRPWAVSAFAWVLAQLGESGQALDRVREAEQLLEQQETQGIVSHRICAYGALGRALLLLDRLDEAQHLGARALESSGRQPGVTAHARHLLGDIATHDDRFDAESAAAHYREALALARLHGMRPLVAHCHLGLGKLYRRNGEAEHARDNLATATTMYRAMEMGFWLERGNAV
jgi:class 3 adenylate cyclase/tetratricopeptide (TPR) repeat protein